MSYIIYGIVDPRNSEIFYVGMSINLHRRINTHYRTRNKVLHGNATWTPTQNRIAEIANHGFIITSQVLDEADNFRQARVREDYWIRLLRDQGYELTNLVAAVGKMEHGVGISPKLDTSGYMTTFQAAAYLSVTPTYIRQLVSKGVLPKFKLGNSNMIPVDAIKAYESSVNSRTP